ncbi:hypothetical protein DENSPDRAFT_886218 [Dentipellis sp. KUC8613]|nr:hypothetical protein DENSPDRAFT_886218 [Dentipellis sp. KUC8613]
MPHPLRLRESEALFNTNHVALVAAPAPVVPSPPPPQTTHAPYTQAHLLPHTPQHKTPGAVPTMSSSCRPVQQAARPACARARAPLDEMMHWRREREGQGVTWQHAQSLATTCRCPTAMVALSPCASLRRSSHPRPPLCTSDPPPSSCVPPTHTPHVRHVRRAHVPATTAICNVPTHAVLRQPPPATHSKRPQPPPGFAPVPLPPRHPLCVVPVPTTVAIRNAPAHAAFASAPTPLHLCMRPHAGPSGKRIIRPVQAGDQL